MVINEGTIKAIYANLKLTFNQSADEAKPEWPSIATKIPSAGRSSNYVWMGQFPRLREWLGDRQISNLSAHSYTIQNRKFESTIKIRREDIEDDNLGVFKPLFQEMGNAAAHHPDELLYELIRSGFGATCFDGRPFFDESHPVKIKNKDEVMSNYQPPSGNDEASPAWFLLDASRPLKPFIMQERSPYKLVSLTNENDRDVFMRGEYLFGVDGRLNVGFAFWQQAFASKRPLTAENFNSLYSSMTSQKSDEGRPLGIKPNILLVGSSNREAAFYIAKAERLANGASNPNYGLLDVIVTPHLD
ncbi:Mu-like prophage major head subunit gpT family protein [Laribacter hongkongensis]|uniref:Mu-like prophage major head subunit gpT family protein n=1 Tax=Laribacter hongkongensis TaxID=168471 RepID=A0ABD4SXE3_9NEIS|nr:Mu-like prophage major head subunit gpT family protein [Laribacter hongkongensis]MCG9027374.1 Mu-like prophage major head subunit gpT family protein [Laribacter hongkongensis]